MSNESDYWCNRFIEIGKEPSIEDFTYYDISSPRGKILHEEMSLEELKDFYGIDYDPLILIKSFDYEVEEIFDGDSFEEKLDIYNEKLEICKQEFKIYLFNFHNVSGPKAERLFQVCFEKNKSFYNTRLDFETFVEFIKEN